MKKIFFVIGILALLSCYIHTNDTSNYVTISNELVKKYNPSNKQYAIIVDFTKNIFSERLYLIDLYNNDIILSSKVSHGYMSGLLYATKLSNVSGSNQSSGGTYKTMNVYNGKWGYSMRLQGLDDNINNLAFNRAIVVHSNKKMKTPWSMGCFATNEDVNKKLIDLTNNGCLLHVITE
jgi:hypothetical protein